MCVLFYYSKEKEAVTRYQQELSIWTDVHELFMYMNKVSTNNLATHEMCIYFPLSPL